MFRHEGPSRSARKNAQLAGYLAFVAGFVNSGGSILTGSFTSHVTGSVGRLGNNVATNDLPAALFAALLVLEPTATPMDKPAPAKTVLLATIFVSFIFGATLGATLTLRASRWAMLLPAVAVLLASTMAFRTPWPTALTSSDGAS